MQQQGLAFFLRGGGAGWCTNGAQMARTQKRKSPSAQRPTRLRVGHVSYYPHRRAWWVYYREAGRQRRLRVGTSETAAECVASLINARLIAAETGFALDDAAALAGIAVGADADAERESPDVADGAASATAPRITVAELRRRFLDHHEHVLDSAMSTVRRYTAATQHLINFCRRHGVEDPEALPIDDFVAYLRRVRTARNGHRNSRRRKLLDSGVRYVLETCRTMYRFGQQRRLLDPALDNPFTEMGLNRLKIRNAKPLFVFSAEQEEAFFAATDPWALAVHFALAKTGLRAGELVHLLIEDVDLDGGWLHVRGKPELGWSVKTGRERKVPVIDELAHLLRHVIGGRSAGPVFRRVRLTGQPSSLEGNRAAMRRVAERRVAAQERKLRRPLSRTEHDRMLRKVWREAGVICKTQLRTSLIRTASALGLEVTCPKAWRHTYATLLAEGGVDPLIRMQVMGHQPAPDRSPLGMTALYTHTSAEVVHRQVEAALRLRPRSLERIEQHLATAAD